jgi:hypothetical protein
MSKLLPAPHGKRDAADAVPGAANHATQCQTQMMQKSDHFEKNHSPHGRHSHSDG